jgi:hypothetical protein
VSDFPKIKRAKTGFQREDEYSKWFDERKNGWLYNALSIKEERQSRAIWARALERELRNIPSELWCPSLSKVRMELTRNAEEDEK